MSGKKNDISLAAALGESEPWTQFLSVSDPHIALMLKINSGRFHENREKMHARHEYKKLENYHAPLGNPGWASTGTKTFQFLTRTPT